MGCIGLFFPNFAVFIVLCHRCSLVISFPINRTLRAGEEVSIQPPLFHPLDIVAFLRGVGVLHCVREEKKESERYLQSSKE
jgi:hypothetical protein